MALSATNRGTGGSGTAADPLTCSPNGTFAAGSLAVLVVGYENTGASGADPYLGITDSLGNTWTSRQRALYDPGAAGAGVVCGIFTSPMNVGVLTSGTTVSVDLSATARWAFSFIEVVGGVYVTGGVGTGSAGTPTVTTASIAINDMVIGGASAEAAAASFTDDADTLNGSWTAGQTTGFGSGNTGQVVISQTKVVTSAGAQTYNPAQAGDAICAWIECREGSFARTATDAITLSDSATRAGTFLRAPTDALHLSDVATRNGTFARSTTETLTLADVAVQFKTIFRTVTDALHLSDVATRLFGGNRTATDAVALSDAATRTGTFNRSSSDSVALSDVATRSGTFNRSASDNITLSDVATRILGLLRSASDAIGLSDVATRVIQAGSSGVAYFRTAVEFITLSDVATRQGTFSRTASESITLSDVATMNIRAIIKTFMESVHDALAKLTGGPTVKVTIE